MSRAGRVTLVRPTRAERVQSLVADAAREMAPACEEACGFFFAGIADFITAPVAESAADLSAHVARQGAARLNVLAPEIAARYEALSQAVACRALELRIEVPPALAVRPPVVTAAAVRVQEQALRAITTSAGGGPARTLELKAVADRLEMERREAQRVFDLASLAAGRGGDQARRASESFATLIRAEEGQGREGLRQQIAAWAAGERQKLEQETSRTWSAVALAAAKLALQESGLTPSAPDLGSGRITAVDPADPSRRMEVQVAPDSGEVRYELSGYKGGHCQPVEQRFLESLSRLLGADLTPQNLRHWETGPACAQPTASTPARASRRFTEEKPAATPGQRDRQRG